ncbi:MAG: helix-turn-helix domain-containing protein [Clostridia bacterium]|nr:helix-turn-helix domain-containing protein [Clostridia bacterium]
MELNKDVLKYMKDNFHNNGYTTKTSALDMCLFLSLEAKQLYSTLSQYCYGKKRECNPSQSRLAFQLRTTRQRINKYVNELREKGIIYTTFNSDGSLTYYLKQIETISIIQHSEIVYKILHDFKAVFDEKLEKIIKQYQESELFITIELSSEPERFKNKIYDWFTSKIDKNSVKSVAQKKKSKMDEMEDMLNYFHERYLDVKGEPMTSNIKDRSIDLENLWRVHKRCGYILEELRKRIDIFFNSPQIQFHNTKVFAQEITQSRLQHASKNNESYITLGLSREKINLFENKKESLQTTDFVLEE